MKLPKITFAMAATDEENVISRSIQHIIDLDYPQDKKELIVAIDGSTDNTANIAKQFVKKYPWIHLIENRERLGKAQAITNILNMSTGEIIIINDAEFFFYPRDGLYKLIKYFEDKKIGGVTFGSLGAPETYFKQGWWTFVNEVITSLFRYYRIQKNPIKSLKEANILLTVNAFKRQAVDKIQTINDDSETAYQILQHNYYIFYAPEVSFEYPNKPFQDTAKSIGEDIKQKTRTTVGWTQVTKLYKINLNKFYLVMGLMLIKLILSLIVWQFVFIYSQIKGRIMSIFGKTEPEKIWKKISRPS